MSRLDELIAELCPDGVEFFSLNILFDQFSGMGGVSGKWAEEGNCRFIDYMNAYKHLSIDVNDLPYATVKKLDQTTLMQGDILFTSASETPDECAISSVIEDKIQDGIFLDDHLFGLRIKAQYRENISPSYLKYVFRTDAFRTQMKKTVRGVTRFYVSKTDFMKLVIPVPPLPVQHEIVRILDSFTELTAELIAELTSELTARKKQYYCYRGSLLTFDDMVNELEFDKLFQFQNGFAFKSGLFRDSGKPILRIQNIQDKRIDTTNLVYFNTNDYSIDLDQYVVRKGDIVVAMSGATTGKIGVSYSEEEFYLNQRVGKFIPKEDVIDNRYLYHLLSSYSSIIYTISSGTGAQPNLSSEKLKKLKTRVPSLEEQHRIANILDKLDAFCNDICNGISSEIVARQKQYEYYRDKLLTFKPLS